MNDLQIKVIDSRIKDVLNLLESTINLIKHYNRHYDIGTPSQIQEIINHLADAVENVAKASKLIAEYFSLKRKKLWNK